MKRIMVMLTVPLLLLGCAETKQYVQGLSTHMQEDCTTKPTFDEVFACTKNRLYNDPVSSIAPNPQINTDLTAYGEYLNSQLRQNLMTDAQARQMFAQRMQQWKAYQASQSQPALPTNR